MGVVVVKAGVRAGVKKGLVVGGKVEVEKGLGAGGKAGVEKGLGAGGKVEAGMGVVGDIDCRSSGSLPCNASANMTSVACTNSNRICTKLPLF